MLKLTTAKSKVLVLPLLAALFASNVALAQEPAPPPVPETSSPASDAQRLSALEQRLEQLEATASTKEEVAEVRSAVEENALAADMKDLQESTEEEAGPDPFKFWGFFDLSFAKYFYPKGSPVAFFVSDKATFLMSNVNLYFKSQMTNSLSALGELRFSFLPHGKEIDYEYRLYERDAEGQWEESLVSGEFTRINTEVQDPWSTMYYRQGGVTIERIHLTWEPRDWFNVIAGRFLTPYGIWNIDHGSPVVIPMSIPYIQLREMVPPAQTGLQVYGRLFLGRSDLFFDYAVTLSNGHGPSDQVIDYDNNKAVGMRLHGTYESPHFSVSLGAYGMVGKYTDQKKVVKIYTTPAGTLDFENKELPLYVDVQPIKEMNEYIVATDLLVELYGLRLQAEYVWTRWNYEKTGPRYAQESLFAGAPPLVDFYRASNVGNACYVMLAYELPLQRLLGDFKIMPYAYYEWAQHDDTLPHAWVKHLIGGFNLKPSPYVTLKLEGILAFSDLKALGPDVYEAAAQMAVSF